jgi:hypothetical protein
MGSEPCVKLMLEVLGAELSLISPQAADDTRMMRAQGFLPNQITFIALLTACVHAGLVEIGLGDGRCVKMLVVLQNPAV